jgi:hypothetical protein
MSVIAQHLAETFMFWTLRVKVGEHRSDLVEKGLEILGVDLSVVLDLIP